MQRTGWLTKEKEAAAHFFSSLQLDNVSEILRYICLKSLFLTLKNFLRIIIQREFQILAIYKLFYHPGSLCPVLWTIFSTIEGNSNDF